MPIRVEHVRQPARSEALHGALLPVLLLVAIALGGCDTRGVLATAELSLERMLNQNKYEAFDEILFVDQRAMRPPPRARTHVTRSSDGSTSRTGSRRMGMSHTCRCR